MRPTDTATMTSHGAAAAFAQRRPRRGWQILSALLLLMPVLVFASHRVAGRIAEDNNYSVAVPVTLRPHDPALWSLVNADSFEAARAIDAALPDPSAVPTLGEGGAALSATELAAMRQQAYTGPVARPYVFRGRTATDTTRAHYCLTAALYYEAASETDDGMRGVAQVILNRTRHPSFPGSICGVVFQGSQRAIVCQFTFSCDGSMARTPMRDHWTRASRIAAEALAGRVFAPVGLATHYHTLAVSPSWGRTLAMTNVIGAHIFHRWRGRFGELAAFSRPYSGREPQPGPYLPIADQLAARAGRPTDAALAAAATMPVPDMSVSAATTIPAPLPGTFTPQPGFASAPAAPAVPPRATPSYADPRLAQSGNIREEYRNSGSSVTR